MLTEGTTKRSAAKISEDIEFLGASLDATTTSDFTTVSLSVMKKDVEKGFELFSDVLLHPVFQEDELKRKKELIKGALRQREEDPAFVANRAFIKEVFGNHPYGRLVEGSVESVERLQRNDVMNFYRTYYAPNNAILSVVGDLTPGELDALINKYLSGWEKGAQRPEKTPGEKSATALLAPSAIKPVTIDRDISQANIILGHIGITRSDPDYYAVQVMNYILGGGGFASRLMRVIRDERGLTYGINSSFVGNKEPGQFEVEVQTKNESAQVVVDEIVKQIEQMR
jgi:zinc protease